MKMVYLATFYSEYGLFAKLKMWYNWHRVNKIVMKCMRRGYVVFSPITHSHIASIYDKGDLTDHDFWMQQDRWYVERCDELWILDHKKMSKSKGCNLELDWARKLNKPIRWLNTKGEVTHAEAANQLAR